MNLATCLQTFWQKMTGKKTMTGVLTLVAAVLASASDTTTDRQTQILGLAGIAISVFGLADRFNRIRDDLNRIKVPERPTSDPEIDWGIAASEARIEASSAPLYESLLKQIRDAETLSKLEDLDFSISTLEPGQLSMYQFDTVVEEIRARKQKLAPTPPHYTTGLLLFCALLAPSAAFAAGPALSGYTLHLVTDTGPISLTIAGPPPGVTVNSDIGPQPPQPIPPTPIPPDPVVPSPGEFNIAPRVYELAKQANDKAGAITLADKSQALAAKINAGAVGNVQSVLTEIAAALSLAGPKWGGLFTDTKSVLQNLVLTGQLSATDPKPWARCLTEIETALRLAAR